MCEWASNQAISRSIHLAATDKGEPRLLTLLNASSWGLPDRRDHADRVRHGLHPAGRLQRLPQLHLGCPYGVIGSTTDRHGPQLHLCYDACRRACSRRARRHARRSRSSSGTSRTCTRRRTSGLRTEAGRLHEGAALRPRDKIYGGLNAFFLPLDQPETYGLVNERNAVLRAATTCRATSVAPRTAALA